MPIQPVAGGVRQGFERGPGVVFRLLAAVPDKSAAVKLIKLTGKAAITVRAGEDHAAPKGIVGRRRAAAAKQRNKDGHEYANRHDRRRKSRND